MSKIPTDLAILKAIYKKYYDDFVAYSKDESIRSTKMYVPIDVRGIAEGFKTDSDMVFGRLHYHLNKKYGYTNEDGSKVHLFALKIGSDKHCVHYPFLASILATMKSESKRFWIATSISIVALILSLIAIFA